MHIEFLFLLCVGIALVLVLRRLQQTKEAFHLEEYPYYRHRMPFYRLGSFENNFHAKDYVFKNVDGRVISTDGDSIRTRRSRWSRRRRCAR